MELDLRRLGIAVRSRLWGIAFVVLCCTAAAGAWSIYYLQPVYQASTKLIVTRPAEASPVSPLDLNTVNLNIKLIDTYKEIIRTPAIMDAVVREHPELGLTAEQLIGKIRIASVNETPVMSLSVQDASYERAADIVNAVARVFRSEIPRIMKVDNVTILNEARTDLHPAPVRPSLEVNMVVAAAVSLLAGLVYAAVRELLDDTLRSEEDVTASLGIPTLAVIADIGRRDRIRHKLRERRQPGSGPHAGGTPPTSAKGNLRYHDAKAGEYSHASIR